MEDQDGCLVSNESQTLLQSLPWTVTACHTRSLSLCVGRGGGGGALGRARA